MRLIRLFKANSNKGLYGKEHRSDYMFPKGIEPWPINCPTI